MNTYIIAEIGINHNGSLETAKKLIDIAALSGCDAVKFQKRNPDVCVPEDLPWLKIPSAMLTEESLLRESARTGKKIIFSVGMSNLDEIDRAVEILREENAEFAMLHCNSTYPAPLEELNLKCIQTLKERYDCEVGYSGHEFRIGTTVASVYLGATILERHITLDRTMWGSDHLASVEPQGLIKLVKGVRELETALGDGNKVVTEGELPVRKKLRGN